MKYCCPLLVVKDIDKSVKFYKEVFGLRVIVDFGANKTLTGGLSLQSLDTWTDFILTDKILFDNNASELYFEEDDFDNFINKLESFPDIKYVHKAKEHTWGQRVVRIYDPDGHILEIGENLKSVALRFQHNGMTIEQVANRMNIPIKNAKALLKL